MGCSTASVGKNRQNFINERDEQSAEDTEHLTDQPDKIQKGKQVGLLRVIKGRAELSADSRIARERKAFLLSLTTLLIRSLETIQNGMAVINECP